MCRPTAGVSLADDRTCRSAPGRPTSLAPAPAQRLGAPARSTCASSCARLVAGLNWWPGWLVTPLPARSPAQSMLAGVAVNFCYLGGHSGP